MPGLRAIWSAISNPRSQLPHRFEIAKSKIYLQEPKIKNLPPPRTKLMPKRLTTPSAGKRAAHQRRKASWQLCGGNLCTRRMGGSARLPALISHKELWTDTRKSRSQREISNRPMVKVISEGYLKERVVTVSEYAPYRDDILIRYSETRSGSRPDDRVRQRPRDYERQPKATFSNGRACPACEVRIVPYRVWRPHEARNAHAAWRVTQGIDRFSVRYPVFKQS